MSPLPRVAAPLLLAFLALPFAACSSAGETVGASSQAVVSPTTTYLLPVDDGVREACRAAWTARWCDAGEAQAAGDACMASLLSAGTVPACASDPAGCFQLLTTATPCANDGAIYSPYPASPSCDAPVARTCAFYSACLEAAKPCGESGYAIGYGEKYCSRYDVDTRFSLQGLAWRDAVLHCLQVSLVAELPKVGTMTCDAITTFAFDSHPRCYTEGPSICFLPFSDIANVIGTIDGKDLLSLRSAKQMATVAGTCIAQLTESLATFDAPAARARIPFELRDRAALGERLQLWQDVQRRGEGSESL
jgi:hypothetical protein